MTHPLTHQLERDIAQTARNQVLIDKLKRPTLKGRLMVQNDKALDFFANHIRFKHVLLFCVLAWAFFIYAVVQALATECPNVGEPCKVLILTPMEEKVLMQANGVLDTAAQARNLDLGQFVVYLKTRIGQAPAGEIRPAPASPAPASKPEENKALDK